MRKVVFNFLIVGKLKLCFLFSTYILYKLRFVKRKKKDMDALVCSCQQQSSFQCTKYKRVKAVSCVKGLTPECKLLPVLCTV